jgi:hypothetical protein
LRDLIYTAGNAGIGLTIEPYRGDGWKIGYAMRWGGGDLVTAPTLDDAVAAAVEPLRELIERRERRSGA